MVTYHDAPRPNGHPKQGLLRFARNDIPVVYHCEERSDEAISVRKYDTEFTQGGT